MYLEQTEREQTTRSCGKMTYHAIRIPSLSAADNVRKIEQKIMMEKKRKKDRLVGTRHQASKEGLQTDFANAHIPLSVIG